MSGQPRAWYVRPSLLLSGAGAVVLAAYAATAARSVTRWDAGEFLAAIHTLGIPHPPGTPVYVLVGRVWAVLPLPGSLGFRISLLSAACAVAAVTLLGFLLRRWTGDTLMAAAAMLSAAGTWSLWLSATEAEVYAPALLVAVLLLLVADSPSASGLRRWVLLSFVAGLGWALHPASLLTLPASVLLAAWRDRGGWRAGVGELMNARAAVSVAAAAVLGASAVLFLVIRAQHDPVINQGNPATLESLWAVLTREQYGHTGMWPRRAPFWLQIGNWLEYADWQFAYALAPQAPPSWLRTPITLAFAALGLKGSIEHRRMDRRSWCVLVVAFLTATIALIAYLNMLLSPSYGHGVIPDAAPREARERDYFFITSFVVWGAWAGIGAVAAVRAIAARAAVPSRGGGIAGVALLASGVPLLLNFPAAYEQRAVASHDVRRGALELLRSVPLRGVLFAIGDNDTYPLWHAQVVEGERRDVTVVTIPLLGTRWYREELARRHGLLNSATEGTWTTVAAVCREAAAQSRPVVLTPYADAGTLTSVCPGIVPGQTSSFRRE